MELELDNPQQQQQNTQDPTLTTTSQEPKEQKVTIDPESIAAIIRQSQPQPQQRQLTPEERETRLNVYKPDRKSLKALRAALDADDTLPDADVLTPFHGLRDGIAKQATTYTDLALEAVIDHFQTQFAPLMKYVAEQQAEATNRSFFTQFPHLEAHKDVVQAVASQLAQQGVKPKDAAETFKLLAQHTEAFIKKVNPSYVPPSTPNAQATLGLAKLNGGGSQGNTAVGQQARTKGRASDIFD